MLKNKRNFKVTKNFINFNASKGLNSTLSEIPNAIQKIKNIVAIRNALYKRLTNKNQRKVINKKMQRLPDILPNERRACSPTNMSDLRKRMISPVSIRKFKITTDKIVPSSIRLIPDSSIKKLTIDCTEEQTIINDKVRLRVMEAKMSRFTGFKSPRVLLSKLIDNKNNTEQYEFVHTSSKLDVVHTNEKCEKFHSFKIQKNHVELLSL